MTGPQFSQRLLVRQAGGLLHLAAVPLIDKERAAEMAEEMLGRAPKPMLTGLSVGALIGGGLVYLWHQRQASGATHAERVTAERANGERAGSRPSLAIR